MAGLAGGLVGLLRGLLALCALLLVAAALYVSLGRSLLPLAAEYRLEAEERARAALALPVQIGRLEGRWQGFAPLLIAHEVQLGEGSSALRLDQLRVQPDLLASLLARQLRVAQVELDGAQLGLVQNAQGGWSLKGLPAADAARTASVEPLLQRLQGIGRVSLLNSQITLEAHERPVQAFTYVNLTLQNSAPRLRLDGRLLLPDGQPVALQLRARLPQGDWRRAQAELYLSLPQSDWARWLPTESLDPWRFARLQGGGELWLSWRDAAVQRAVARLHAPHVDVAYAERPAQALSDLAVSAYFNRTEQGFQLLVDDLALSQGETRWGEVRLALRQQPDSRESEERWLLSADRLELAALAPLVTALAPLPEQSLQLLEQLQPRGALRNLQLDYRPRVEGARRLQFAANLEGVGFAALAAVPAVEHVSGSIGGDLAQGELRLDSEDFALHLQTLFPKPWRYRKARARLNWQLDEQGFTLRSPYLRVEGEEGEIAGDFLIRLLRDPAAEDYMDLRVGLRHGDARFTEKYLPTRSPGLSPALAEWLTSAIRAGKVQEGYFQYQGSLHKGAPETARSLSLFFAVEAAELAFQPGWPALREGRGEVLVEPSGVRVRLSEGRLLDSRISAASAQVPRVPAGEVARLQLQAQLQSSVGDALRLLQEAPMGTAEIFAGWQGEGALSGALSLDLPLRKGQAPRAVVDFSSDGARLELANPSLVLSELRGDFRYDSSRGLSAPAIRARALGHAVKARALAEGQPGRPSSRIEASGEAPLAALSAWLGVSQPLPLSGSVPYRLALTLDGPDSQLHVTSNLQGLAIEWPAPFGKASDEARDAEWRMTLSGPERRYWLDYADLASLALAAAPGQLDQGRGELRLGSGKASLPGKRGLRLRGRLAELDWSAWQAALKPYARSPSEDAEALLADARLEIDRFQGFGSSIENLGLTLTPAAFGWDLGLDSRTLKGRVSLPDAAAAPIGVELEYLRLPPAAPPTEPAIEQPDPFKEIDPRALPALNLSIAQVYRGEELVGGASLQLRPDAAGVRFEELKLDLKGLSVSGIAGWQGRPGASRSWYQGRLQGQDLAKVLQAWGFAPTASSESFRLDVDGNWPGSPAWVSLKRFSGSLDATLRNGQFVQAQGSASALRVFGLLNFDSIGRRLRLDFSDLFGRGLSYDRVKGLLVASDGIFVTRKPITLAGPSSNLELDGSLNMIDQTIDAKLLVTLPVTNNLPLAALIVGAPAIGGALFVVEKLLGDSVARFASVQYDVEGPLQNPEISFDKPFEKPQ